MKTLLIDNRNHKRKIIKSQKNQVRHQKIKLQQMRRKRHS